MTLQVKKRIEQIRRGEVPEGYKKTKVGIVPVEWGETRFKKMFSRLLRKNKENNDNVLTISAQYGLISQRDFFNKDIASEDKSNYFLLYKGEFAYNKSYSNGYPFGALKRLEMYDKGIVSPLYICFFANENNTCPDFYVHYFEAGMMNREIQAFAQEGARNHGLLNISVDDFFNSYMIVPPLAEQERIAEILSAQDKLIALKERLIEEKKRQKKYLMQQLLTGKKRLPGFSDKWQKTALEKIVIIRNGYAFKSTEYSNEGGGYKVVTIKNVKDGVLDMSQHNCVAEIPKDIQSYQILSIGDVLVSLTGNVGRVCRVSQNGCLLNQRVGKLEFSPDFDSDFAYQIVRSPIFLDSMTERAAGAAQSNLSIGYIYQYEFSYPIDFVEQREIAKILNLIENETELLNNELQQEKQKKKALMQLLLTGIVRTTNV